MSAVLPEDAAERVPKCPFAGALSASKDKRGLGPLRRVLKGPGDPIQDVLGRFLVASRQNLNDVPPHQRPAAGLGLDAPTAPQVQAAIYFVGLARLEYQSIVLPAIRVLQPPMTERDWFRASDLDGLI